MRPEFAAVEEVFSRLLDAGKQWQASHPAALFRQAQLAQRVADRLPDVGSAGMRPHKARNSKARLQFEPPVGRNLGLLSATEPGKGGGA